MPYIERDQDGNICALFRHAEPGREEFLSPSHPDILEFLSSAGDQALVQQALNESDAQLARVTEDLIHLLISKNVILFTELPDPVQSKLLAREKIRSTLQEQSGSFLVGDEDF